MPPVSRTATPRIELLDFVKGALVLVMVLYHWLNYFVSTQGDFYRYLRFLTPSFIFVTGFLISHLYWSSSRRSERSAATKLAKRGLKILGLFVGLNLLRFFVVPDSRAGFMPTAFWSTEDLFTIFVSGNYTFAHGKVASFNILVPISYLLLLAACVEATLGRIRFIATGISVASLLLVFGLGLVGIRSGNLELLAIGALGLGAGQIPVESITRLASHQMIVVAAYISYVVALTIWNVNYPMQIVGVAINLLGLCVVDARLDQRGVLYQACVLLGQYSLVGYIAQIAVLQVLNRLFASRDILLTTAGCLVAAAVGTTLAVYAVDWSRTRLQAVDRMYRGIFA